ncbi:MAG: RNA-binding protein [Bacteroidetes bacterium]|nr:MAG: RNA-binding protein [Bacteroidota bacterium]
MKWTIACLLFCFTVSCTHQPDSMFVSMPSSTTNISFANNLEKRERFNILYYLYYYNGGGVAIGDINNDGLPDIFFTANSKGNNKLYLNKGNFQFEDISEKAGIQGNSDWCTGATMADVNGDGLLDIYVCAIANTHGLRGHNELFINNGNGTFTESSAKYGLNFSGFSTQAVFFDYDNDGDLDCYLLNQSHYPNSNIVDTSNRRKYDSLAGDRLMRNDLVNGERKFVDVSARAGIYQSNLGYGLGIAVADFNNDGWQDIYVGNDFHENDYYYLNNGNGTFTESGARHFNHYSRFSMGNDAADFNNDGQMDVVTVDMLPPDEKTLKTYGSDEHFDIYNQKIIRNGFQNQVSRNCLQRNNGDGASFSDVGLLAGVSATDWSWSPLLADFDNDGNKDLFISSGIVKRPVDLDYVKFISNVYNQKVLNSSDKMDDEALEKMPDGSSHPFFFKGDGSLQFRDVSDSWGTGGLKGYYNGAAYADLNNDGKLDLVINCLNAPALIFKNNAPSKHYLTIGLKGDSLNSSGIGAKAYLYAGGKMQYQQLMLTRGFMSSSDPRLHFGLDSLNKIDSLLIVWPSRKFEVIRNVPVDSILWVKQQNAKGDFNYNQFFPKQTPVLEDISRQVHLPWSHQENIFIDYNYHYLIPHMESTRGPKMAVADVNKDGLDDFFVCGSNSHAGTLFIQTKDGTFFKSDTALFNKNKICEGVDAVFFDSNKDGYPDLYVVSGGNQYEDGSLGLSDHFYINDGKGHFKESDLPPILTNKSCVAVGDVNQDGYPDLFIGGFANANQYGYPQSSFLLLNDGYGNFRPADSTIIRLKDIGMVTSASFTDVNGDGWPDLVVAGEWMPVKVFINNKSKFTAADLPQSTGLWQSVFITDLNKDGHPDILAGNWGHNSKLYAGKNGPLKLYVKDFDRNGSVEQVMTYTIDGKEYPFLPKDELERQLPILRKAYLTYGEVAGKTVDYIFYDLFNDYLEDKAEVLGSSAFINDGKGNFVRQDLDPELQLSPIFSFQQTADSSKYFSAGNFLDVPPYEGRYDAASLQEFEFFHSAKGAITEKTKFLDNKSQARDLKWLRTTRYGDVLLEARNNDSLVFWKYNH